mgnify:CR=1 FL=1
MPYTAKLKYDGTEPTMTTAHTPGACNTSHTNLGLTSATPHPTSICQSPVRNNPLTGIATNLVGLTNVAGPCPANPSAGG